MPTSTSSSRQTVSVRLVGPTFISGFLPFQVGQVRKAIVFRGSGPGPWLRPESQPPAAGALPQSPQMTERVRDNLRLETWASHLIMMPALMILSPSSSSLRLLSGVCSVCIPVLGGLRVSLYVAKADPRCTFALKPFLDWASH